MHLKFEMACVSLMILFSQLVMNLYVLVWMIFQLHVMFS